ncbi:hypothetical protein BDV33DRAFT_178507 [Aspergillus novoparasiticus]|uniref:Transmembrane protein n=1 Tax=Aspergillus novoparasiticus TaxID=986946 RepID=A0A5N6EGD4_9EURO|nr:hypothetical protein BDV33DRAFT_178507 [Aspergillus novoparasiticus]
MALAISHSSHAPRLVHSMVGSRRHAKGRSFVWVDPPLPLFPFLFAFFFSFLFFSFLPFS